MTFAETLRFLLSLGPELKTVKWDLERIETLLATLGSPHKRGRFIHVAGTNGKGSTCAMMASALRAEG
jgi:dihydrofolate synthase/folylpolyglutamate synthase